MAKEAVQLRKSIRTYGIFTLIFCIFGIILSVYALYVEIHAEGDSKFRAWCDINSKMSCSKVFTSRFGKGFGLLEFIVGKDSILNQPNSIFGILYYILQILCVVTLSQKAADFAFGTSIVANLGSMYLGYILVFILNDICVVCVSTYVVNAVILMCSYTRRNKILELKQDKKRR